MARKYVTVTLSSTGLTSTSTDFSIYNDSNNFGYPTVRNVTNIELTSTTSPYVTLVPSNATKIMVLDTNNGTKTYADINSNYLCDTCDLEFNSYETATVGRLIAGNLTGSCDTSIDDYRVFWYGPDSLTNVAYISGKGSQFNYNFTHPLTGNTAIFADAGEYVPVIDKLNLNGLAFSQTGDTTGNVPIPADLICFETVSVAIDAFKCDNGGTSDLSLYSHKVKFTALGNGSVPQPLQSTFLLSANTKYFAIRFEGELVEDEIKITFKGSHYNNIPILLEYWKVGEYVSPNETTLPYGWNTFNDNPFKKLINFENIVVNHGDKLILEVIPNTSNPQTNWEYYFGCVNDDIECDFCTDPAQYKIQQSSISYNATTDCSGDVNVSFNVSGCSASSIATLLPNYTSSGVRSGLGDYFGEDNTLAYYLTPDGSNRIGVNFTTNTGYTACTYYNPTPSLQCSLPASGGKIKLTKSVVSGVGKIDMEFDNFSDLVYYYNGYLSVKNSIWSTPVPDTVYSSYTNTYYKMIQLSIPDTESDPNKLCGDGITSYTYRFHPSAVVTTGGTSSPWTMTINMPIITENISGTIIPCYLYCSSNLNTYLSSVNGSSTATTNNKTFITNSGQKFLYPYQTNSFYRSSTAGWNSNARQGWVPSLGIRNYTTAFSGVSNTLIPSLTAITCSNVSSPTYKYDFNVVMESNFKDFKVYAAPITGGIPSGSYSVLVLTSSGGTITVNDPSYVY